MEKQLNIAGIAGRLNTVKNPGVRAAGCFDAQLWTSIGRPVEGYGDGAYLFVEMRHDDSCGNRHNTFSITGYVRDKHRNIIAGGCLHEDIAAVFPELEPLIKWHLSSTDSPMHYVANTLYWLGYQGYCGEGRSNPPNIDFARKAAVWLDMPEAMVCPEELRAADKARKATLVAAVTETLTRRLPGLLAEFRAAVEGAGFQWEHAYQHDEVPA